MPDGLKKHTHEERAEIIEKLVPEIKERFGDNLVALAATASFARGDDGAYSDLELTAFLKEFTPREEKKPGAGVIYDGMLIELILTTKEKYLKEIKSTHVGWYFAGSDVMQAIINEPFITELMNAPQTSSADEHLAIAKYSWPEVQESTSKVLKAIERDDLDALGLVYGDMVRHTLITLSFLNAKPYTTFATMIPEARHFSKKPSTFEHFVNPLKEGFGDPKKLEQTVLATFSEMEQLLYENGIKPYVDELKLFS